MQNPNVLLTVTCLILLLACTKDKKKINPEEVRLIGWEFKADNGDMHRFTISYDGADRISRFSTSLNNQSQKTLFTVIYSANEAIMVRFPPSDPSLTIADTIRLILDGTGRPLDRIEHNFAEFSSPHPPQRSYKYDTIHYEYDGVGLLIKETRVYRDTTWFNPGVIETSVTTLTGMRNYSSAGENIVAHSTTSSSSSVTRRLGNIYTSGRSSESTVSFEYKQDYQNKTDFTNAAILKELHFWGDVAFDKSNINIPEKITTASIEKDQNGAVISSQNSTQNFLFTYNSYGFVSSVADPANPNSKTIFLYRE
jgi:hypothetical protein